MNGVFTAGTGQPRWRVLATPYTPLRGTPNPAGSVEVQSVIAFPRSVTIARPRITIARNVATLAIAGSYGAPAGVTPSLRLYRGSGRPRRGARWRFGSRAAGTPARSACGRRCGAR